MRGSFRVGKVAGIPILVNPSWLIVLGLFTFLLATEVYPQQLPDSSRWVHTGLALVGALLFFSCILAHELAHSLVAKLHRIPVQSITLFLFGGVSQMTREARTPRSEFLIAIVGPLTSLAIGGVLIGLLFLFIDTLPDAALATLAFIGVANVGLGVFNLLPAFPMDGGRVFRSIVWGVTKNYLRATLISAWAGRLLYWGIIAVGVMALMGVDVYIADNALQGLWLIAIGYTLDGFARTALTQTRVLRALESYTAADIMQRDLPTVTGEQSLGLLAHGAFKINPRLTYFVEDEGKLAGILTMFQVFTIPEANWDGLKVREAMLPSSSLRAVEPERRLSDILMDMESQNMTHMPVVENGTVVGLIGRDGIARLLRSAGLLRTPAPAA